MNKTTELLLQTAIHDDAQIADVSGLTLTAMRIRDAAADMHEALLNIKAWTTTPGECTLDVIRACVLRTLAKVDGKVL